MAASAGPEDGAAGRWAPAVSVVGVVSTADTAVAHAAVNGCSARNMGTPGDWGRPHLEALGPQSQGTAWRGSSRRCATPLPWPRGKVTPRQHPTHDPTRSSIQKVTLPPR